METKFEEIYRLFLSSVDDYELSEVSEEELNEVMKTYLIKAVVTLQMAMMEVGEFDEDLEIFKDKLSHPEKVILGKSMKLEWLGEKLYSADLMRKDIGDRDYKAVQGTDYLRQIGVMESRLRKEIHRDIIDLSYTDKSEMGGLW
ncbi:hypothetical protein [Vagococcus fluvialis]|uniref:hypothetical protein n=1 Tax=Vagococcus fluvialis TaxID=2738 RepID=UPI001D09CF0E|nr:hypothetical protein [Vagococcus fluvialis]UDM72743.1 hypothetical protein K5L00_14390 [Vagococcus fluvialis]UDM78465.1 hypothetical protein K5K98_14595 [Vagococcus fluvialis]UDM84018.1 hypothetical protein K5K96_14415 [Vagococcus fluvialis]